ncbi:hypothetical protein C7974DRAFT_418196 [Boeremia exigua]|uniref:uncharacterized protein n=1 Tax=Boeremia exigua TaxID=749465 RepID=UPI001E8E01D3|nr:uncharacterized protein C7974DRAFT_418196 [Boeremia exigua]KAH6613107.1 hypothetical protein C7974DRAFT_418196 [Boeremia exigua]
MSEQSPKTHIVDTELARLLYKLQVQLVQLTLAMTFAVVFSVWMVCQVDLDPSKGDVLDDTIYIIVMVGLAMNIGHIIPKLWAAKLTTECAIQDIAERNPIEHENRHQEVISVMSTTHPTLIDCANQEHEWEVKDLEAQLNKLQRRIVELESDHRIQSSELQHYIEAQQG